MSTAYLGITDPAGGLPTISKAIQHAGLVYLCGITPDPTGDIRTQTGQVLERIDLLLLQAGSHKSRLLSAQVWLTDMADFATLNEVWNAWVDPKHPPVRACVEARPYRPGIPVETMATAAQ